MAVKRCRVFYQSVKGEGLAGLDPVLGFYNRLSDIVFSIVFDVVHQLVGGLDGFVDTVGR